MSLGKFPEILNASFKKMFTGNGISLRSGSAELLMLLFRSGASLLLLIVTLEITVVYAKFIKG